MSEQDITLADLATNDVETIQDVRGDSPTVRRLMELGFVPGAKVRYIREALGGDPIIVEVDGSTQYALRRAEAKAVIVT